MNVFLIGYRGTGKTTVGELLAEELGWAFVDSDAEIVASAGRSVAEIFADDGEAAFRILESEAIARLAAGERQVIGLGGGAILADANRQVLAERGHAVWLTAPPELLAQRLTADPNTAAQRPSLTGAPVAKEIDEVLAARTPLYRQCADLEVDTQDKTPAEIAHAIHTALVDRLSP